jgi:hypothetical protein
MRAHRLVLASNLYLFEPVYRHLSYTFRLSFVAPEQLCVTSALPGMELRRNVVEGRIQLDLIKSGNRSDRGTTPVGAAVIWM